MGGRSGLIYMISLVLNSSVLLMSSTAGGKLVPLADGCSNRRPHLTARAVRMRKNLLVSTGGTSAPIEISS